jgi:hypothetical protein
VAAARLLGAATQLLVTSGGARDTQERAVYDHTQASIEAALPAAARAAAWATGQGWTWAEAVAQVQATG